MNNSQEAKLNRIEAMLLQLLALQPLPIHNASFDEFFDAGLLQGKTPEQIIKEFNEMKEAQERNEKF